MGCDIHMFTEVKENDTWVSADLFAKNVYNDKDYELIQLMGTRNYYFFATLVGVRNGFSITPIKEPKGFPRQVSFYANEEYDRYKGDAHHPSYYSLKQLKNSLSLTKFTEDQNKLILELIKRLETRKRLFAEINVSNYTDSQIRIVFFFDN